MRILLVNNTKIPVHFYGGTERIIWWLGKALSDKGHEVSFLVKKGSSCPFARVLTLREKTPLANQIPDDVDLVHLHFESSEVLPKPTVTTVHGNSNQPKVFYKNTVFVSHNHAQRHGGSVFVYNGLDWDDYGEPAMDNRRSYFHFLGNAAWRVKNVRGAIELTGKAGERLHVLGGTRVNFRMGLRVTLSPNVRFHGMVGGDGKNVLLNGSKGLVFPVLWHEPFGLAIIESLFFGCPVFGTPYGALPELLGGRMHEAAHSGGQVEALYSEFGRLSIKKSELVEAIKSADDFDRNRCRQYVADNFSAARMAADYLKLYEKVLNGQDLHAQAPTLETAPENKLLPLEP
jgi:glycosyltransferase involved in cell wall biosynthesis